MPDEPDDDNPRPITPMKRTAYRIAAMRFAMGRAETPEQALNDAVLFVKAAETRWPGISKDGGVM